MNDKKMIRVLRKIVTFSNVILMGLTLVFQIWKFEILRHTILCSCSLLLLTVTLILDGFLKDTDSISIHCSWYALWLFNLIINLLNF